MKSVVDYFVTPNEFNKFLDSLKKHEIEAIVTEGSYSRPEEGKEFLDKVIQDTWDEMKALATQVNSSTTLEDDLEELYTLEVENVEDMTKFSSLYYSFANGEDSVVILNPITLVDTGDKHIVKAARVKGGTVYDTYYLNKTWTYMVTYGEDK